MTVRHTASENPDARILVVDDHEASAAMIERVLRGAGYHQVTTTSDPRKVLALFRDVEPDILLLDVRMPHLDGFAVMRQVRARSVSTFFPILMITGDTGTAVKRQALSSGASDFLQKPFDATEVVLRVRNLLHTRTVTRELENQVKERAAALERSEVEIAQRLALVAELRDYHSGEHTQRVGSSAALIARAMGLPEEQVGILRLAAPLHDIGKIAISDRILLKEGALSLDEVEIVKHHTSFGARMLSGSESVILQQAEEIALYHHENWDGTGYTPGLEGEVIPVAARIVRVADVFDALVHERPYKRAWPVEEALDLIADGAASTFDPDVVAAFLDVQAAEGLTGRPQSPAESLAAPGGGPDLSPLLRHFEPFPEAAAGDR